MDNHNSSALARQVAGKLELSQAEGLVLYRELTKIGDGPVKDALDRLSRDNTTDGKRPALARYAAVVKAENVRDVQYAKHMDADPSDEEAWVDAGSIPVFLKIVEADTPVRAKQMAAVYAGTDESVIELYPM